MEVERCVKMQLLVGIMLMAGWNDKLNINLNMFIILVLTIKALSDKYQVNIYLSNKYVI